MTFVSWVYWRKKNSSNKNEFIQSLQVSGNLTNSDFKPFQINGKVSFIIFLTVVIPILNETLKFSNESPVTKNLNGRILSKVEHKSTTK